MYHVLPALRVAMPSISQLSTPLIVRQKLQEASSDSVETNVRIIGGVSPGICMHLNWRLQISWLTSVLTPVMIYTVLCDHQPSRKMSKTSQGCFWLLGNFKVHLLVSHLVMEACFVYPLVNLHPVTSLMICCHEFHVDRKLQKFSFRSV